MVTTIQMDQVHTQGRVLLPVSLQLTQRSAETPSACLSLQGPQTSSLLPGGVESLDCFALLGPCPNPSQHH